EARNANSFLFDIIGLLFIAPGLWLGHTALTAYPVTRMTWIMGGVMLLYLAERGYRVLIPKGQRLSIEEWKRQHNLGETASINLKDVKPIEQLLSSPDIQEAQQKQLQNNKWAAPIVGVFAVVLVCVGAYQGFDVARLESRGLRAEGEIIRLKEEHSSGDYS